jgi:hypothetical protein
MIESDACQKRPRVTRVRVSRQVCGAKFAACAAKDSCRAEMRLAIAARCALSSRRIVCRAAPPSAAQRADGWLRRRLTDASELHFEGQLCRGKSREIHDLYECVDAADGYFAWCAPTLWALTRSNAVVK